MLRVGCLSIFASLSNLRLAGVANRVLLVTLSSLESCQWFGGPIETQLIDTLSMRTLLITSLFLLAAVALFPLQGTAKAIDLTDTDKLKPHNAVVEVVTFKGQKALKAEISEEAKEKIAEARQRQAASGRSGPRAGEADRVDHLIVVAEDFHNGTIELEVAGQPAPGSAGGARGFVGVAFRVQPDRKTYDCFYLRPTNGRAEDQERRNHSAQYISHPEYPWFKLRQETPSKYETYVDLQPATWTKVKIVVEGEKARLYVHGNEQPSLIINDVKSGVGGKGGVALWFEGSTVAHYANLKISN